MRAAPDGVTGAHESRPSLRATVEKNYGAIYGKTLRRVSTGSLRVPCVGPGRVSEVKSVKSLSQLS